MPGEPNSSGDEDCLIFYKTSVVGFNDKDCRYSSAFICEHKGFQMLSHLCICYLYALKWMCVCACARGLVRLFARGCVFVLRIPQHFCNTIIIMFCIRDIFTDCNLSSVVSYIFYFWLVWRSQVIHIADLETVKGICKIYLFFCIHYIHFKRVQS